MKATVKFFTLILFSGAMLFSCKKETSCEGCINGNKPPLAVAGPDQVFTLPTDSVSLDGSLSSDPDGMISSYLWTKIYGPASFNINNPTSATTVVKNIAVGIYRFELKVTDDKGLSAKDTMMVTVDSMPTTNHPPIANAGADQTITLPTNTINLDGSGSTDPDNNITNYAWTKISGPSSFNIANANTVQTQVTNLIQGTYQFELKVTDAGGLNSNDTMQTIVNLATSACNIENRPEINATLTEIGTLSEGKIFIAAGAAGNKIVFAGGQNEDIGSSTVDIYDVASNSWSTAQLSIPRWSIAVATCGNKIFFGGGVNTDGLNFCDYYNNVDVYDASNNTWSVISLSEGKMSVAATSLGNKVFFGGGYRGGFQESDKVEIYDVTTNQWSYSNLSQGREGMTANVAGGKIYFTGGVTGYVHPTGQAFPILTARIDIYDYSNNSWSASSLVEPKWLHTSVAAGNRIYWAGGYNGSNRSCLVEIKDAITGNSSIANLHEPGSWETEIQNTVLINGKIVFFTRNQGAHKFDIYDIATDTWSIGVLPANIDVEVASIISVNNTIYVAGGVINGVISNQVWKLEF